ncbi:hypothetical protein FHW88_001082 [Mucilaginibacter sp. SG538B]|nr:hypothetical protein [Mucilaginibacter sp. SG538B]
MPNLFRHLTSKIPGGSSDGVLKQVQHDDD